MRRLIKLLRRRRSNHTRQPIDSEQLLQVYRETHRHVEDLRRAA